MLMFRLALMFVLGDLFKESSGDLGEVLPLTRRAAGDMVLGAVLAPLAATDVTSPAPLGA